MWGFGLFVVPGCLVPIPQMIKIEEDCLRWEKAMATHSSTLAWRIPGTEEPGGLQSMGSQRVRHDRETSLSLLPFLHWRRKWQPTPVLLPGESQGWGSLVGCRLWGHTESDTTEVTAVAATSCLMIHWCFSSYGSKNSSHFPYNNQSPLPN